MLLMTQCTWLVAHCTSQKIFYGIIYRLIVRTNVSVVPRTIYTFETNIDLHTLWDVSSTTKLFTSTLTFATTGASHSLMGNLKGSLLKVLLTRASSNLRVKSLRLKVSN